MNGRRAFVKALGVGIHRPSVELYRSEAASMPHLPAGLPLPRLLDVYDDGEWVVLVYEEVDGRHPAVPWRSDELERVVGAMADLAAALQPSAWPGGPAFAHVYGAILGAWRELGHHPDLAPWLRRRLDRLAAQEIDLAELVRGDALLHTDIRSDNLLLCRKSVRGSRRLPRVFVQPAVRGALGMMPVTLLAPLRGALTSTGPT